MAKTNAMKHSSLNLVGKNEVEHNTSELQFNSKLKNNQSNHRLSKTAQTV